MRRREPVVVRAAFVSQENCRELLGIDARRFLELLLPLCTGHVTPLGKLRLVPLGVAEDRLQAHARDGDPTGDDDQRELEPQPETADEVLAMLGRRRTA